MFRLVLVVVVAALGVLNAQQTIHSVDGVVKNPWSDVTKCCDGFYDPLKDLCQHHHGEANVTTVPSDVEDVTQKHTLPQCPQGYITQVSADVPSGEEQLEGSCAAQVESPEGDVQLVGRFCVADPCTGSKCIRKCCPHGMAISGLTHSCLSHGQNFTPEVRSDGGVVEDAGDMLILGGSKLPNCTLGIQMLRPNIDSYDEFHLLLSGSAYVPSHSMDYDEYCTDTFLDHNMTEAVLLICFSAQEEVADQAIYPYLMLVSAAFPVATFLVYASVRQLHNLHGVIVMCYSISLAVLFIGLAIIKLATHSLSNFSCILLAVISHYTFISTFAWLNVLSFNTWRSFSQTAPSPKRSSTRRTLMSSMYAWGLPLFFVVSGRIMDSLETGIRPKFGEVKCWFADDASLAVYLYGPVGFLILMNVVLFGGITAKLCRASSPQSFEKINAKRKIYVVFALVVLTGVTWIMEIVSFVAGGNANIWIFTDVLNISTGIFVFFIFVCNKRVRSLICGRQDTQDTEEPVEMVSNSQMPSS